MSLFPLPRWPVAYPPLPPVWQPPQFQNVRTIKALAAAVEAGVDADRLLFAAWLVQTRRIGHG